MKPHLSKDKNFYIINRKKYVRLSRVMEILPNIGLEKWRKEVGEDEAERRRKETAEYGNEVHRITMYYDQGKRKKVLKMVEEQPYLSPHLYAWIQYCEKYIKAWIAIEIIVWSDRLMVAGTIDRVDQFVGEKKLCLHDLKTGTLYDEIGVRLAGYKIMWNERERRKIERYSAVQLPREAPGEIRVKEYTDEKYERKFEEICDTYHKMYD